MNSDLILDWISQAFLLKDLTTNYYPLFDFFLVLSLVGREPGKDEQKIPDRFIEEMMVKGKEVARRVGARIQFCNGCIAVLNSFGHKDPASPETKFSL